MAGLSMGGGQTFQITMKHLDKFSYIGGFSGAGGMMGGPFDAKTAYNGALADAASFNKKVKLVWLGIGTAEPERMYKSVKNFHDASSRPASSIPIGSLPARRTNGKPGAAR